MVQGMTVLDQNWVLSETLWPDQVARGVYTHPTHITPPMQQITCEACHQLTVAHDVVNYGSMEGGYRRLCGQCFNAAVASRLGQTEFEHISFEPVCMADARGDKHEFHFRTRLGGPGIALEAFELRDGSPAGYQFQVIGDSQDDPLKLLGSLIGRMRRALAINHLEDSVLGPQVSDRLILRGTIDNDPDEDHQVPLVVIDGREYLGMSSAAWWRHSRAGSSNWSFVT